MIKAKLGKNDLLFGLSEGNIRKLKKGEPIKIDLKEMGMEGTIFICYGKTEMDIMYDLKKAGMITPDTQQRGT